MTIQNLSNYAAATGVQFAIVGQHCNFRIVTDRNTGEKVMLKDRTPEQGYVEIQDARSSNHWVGFKMLDSGLLFGFTRRNWVNGATQTSFKKEWSFEDHVQEVINA